MLESQTGDISCSTNPQKQPAAKAINITQPVPGETVGREKGREGSTRNRFCESALPARKAL